MEPALSIVATIELCFKYGKKLIDMYQTFKGAQAELDEKILAVRSIWLKTSMQLEFLKTIESELSPEHHGIHSEMLHLLYTKLSTVCVKLKALQEKQVLDRTRTSQHTVLRLKYTFAKPHLEGTIEELRRWQEMYDPTWFLIMRIAKQSVDNKLRRTAGDPNSVLRYATTLRESVHLRSSTHVSVFLSGSRLDRAKLQAIPHSTAGWSRLPGSSSGRRIVIDHVSDGGVNPDCTTKDIRSFATRLRSADPARFGLLRCRGVVRLHDNTGNNQGFDIILDVPTQSQCLPYSLRSCLLSRKKHNLSDRFALARRLANATNYVHTLGFVHKGIRPENVVCFDEDPVVLGPFYLIGFEQIRSADGKTNRYGDSDRAKDIYKHPSRQGLYPCEDYCMQHDIYSLGVCLLEIGLWTSFVAYNHCNIPEVDVKSMNLDEVQTQHPGTDFLKCRLVNLAKTALPTHMGSSYADIVANCLTCLDSDNDDFGDRSEFEDEDGILIGLKYIEKVLTRLNNISV